MTTSAAKANRTADIVDRLETEIARLRTAEINASAEAVRLRSYNEGLAVINRRLEAENEKLRALLSHADDVVIWEHTSARYGFQEEIEEALGISDEQGGTDGKL